MLIDIPERKQCYRCTFCDDEQGYCHLAEAMGKTEINASKYANAWEKTYCKYHQMPSDEEELRPEWCPFKENSDG